MRANLPNGPNLLAGAAGLALGALAGMTGGLFGLKGPVPAMLLGLMAAAEAIKLEQTRNPRDLRNVAVGAVVGGTVGIIAMALAREPLAHMLPLTANYALMGALAGAWFCQASTATLLGALAGGGLGAGLALVTGRLQAGHITMAISGPLAVILQSALGMVTGGIVATVFQFKVSSA